jgi:hypothetical protein
MLTKRTNGSNTKRGPGRIPVQGNGTKTAKQRAAGSYGAGLIAAGAAKRREALAKKSGLRDENGAYTCVGRQPLIDHGPGFLKYREPRRMWLAGISAQRGF